MGRDMANEPRAETVKIPLGASARVTQWLVGGFFTIVEATGDVNVYVEGRYKLQLAKGMGYRAAPGQQFSRLDFEDASGAANTVEIIYGAGDIADNRSTISGAVDISGGSLDVPAGIDDAADVALNNAAETSLGDAPDGTVERIVVSDPVNTENIRIGKTGQVGAARGVLLQPGQSITISGSATPYAYAGAAGQKVSQVFVVLS
jgi:hypothetical protein